jgi:hypothetical protein
VSNLHTSSHAEEFDITFCLYWHEEEMENGGTGRPSFRNHTDSTYMSTIKDQKRYGKNKPRRSRETIFLASGCQA